MNKAFEKILERLDEMIHPKNLYFCKYARGGCRHFYNDKDCMDCVVELAKEIVQEVAEEYNNGWIPCSEQLPRDYEEVLADVRGIGFDSSKDAEMIGHFFQNGKWFYSHGMQYLVINGEKTKVIAWKPLPEPFKER